MITGESSPVAKRGGDSVCGGTANQHGSVLMRAERVGEETMLAQVTSVAAEVGGVVPVAGPKFMCIRVEQHGCVLEGFVAGEGRFERLCMSPSQTSLLCCVLATCGCFLVLVGKASPALVSPLLRRPVTRKFMLVYHARGVRLSHFRSP